MKRILFFTMLVVLMNLPVQHATAQPYTIWHSPLGLVSGSPDLTIDIDFTALNSAPRIRASQSVDASVNLGLTLPSNAVIDAVIVCYQSSNAGTFISQTRLTRMSSPESAAVIYDDGTDRTDLGPTCYTSVVPSPLIVDRVITLSLRLVYASAAHTIRIGAIGVTVTPSSTNTASEQPKVFPRPGLDPGVSYPNPFSERTTIEYRVDQPAQVQVRIYDVQGRLVRNLADAYQPSGIYRVEWDGRDDSGYTLPSGAYFYQLQAGEAVSAKNIIRIR